ncbi:hypothetical protein EON65_12255 [archaeon]|nr:MAG: hypothetical protein EON65_12255 [archaeon]
MHGKRSSNPISFLPTPLREHASDMFVMLFDCFEQCCDWYCRLQDFDFINNSDEEFAMYLYLDDFHTWAELNAWLSAIAIHNQLGGPPDEQSEQLMQQRGYLRLKSGLTMTPSISMLVQLLRQKCTIRMLNNRQELAHKAVVLSLQWLREIALSCDGLCSLACTILDSDRLCRLMLHDMYLDKEIGVAFHNLLLSLMADQSFKMTSAVAYALAYRKICSDFSRGIGMVGNTIFNLSVQFLNREHFVNEVAYHHNLLEHGVMALQDMLRVVLPADNSFFQSLSITKRRYTVVIGDFKVSM